ncbi:uncharacterized protein A4U43_C05F28670 [Asparagus officinalis]|uniref:Uncharacterized protein n=1 Tax=Asparagus officinalis TaxID=4686 RepID=A0A5P1EVM0_ASPOF|nr:uncharacterized protein A4U43_C05F28670 [Asparagus officinalis]
MFVDEVRSVSLDVAARSAGRDGGDVGERTSDRPRRRRPSRRAAAGAELDGGLRGDRRGERSKVRVRFWGEGSQALEEFDEDEGARADKSARRGGSVCLVGKFGRRVVLPMGRSITGESVNFIADFSLVLLRLRIFWVSGFGCDFIRA